MEKISAVEKVELIKSGKLSAEKNIKDFLEKIKSENKRINAVLIINDKAIEEAKKVDDKLKKKQKLGRLAGLGIIVKSNICVEGIEINCASKTLEGWVAPYDATVISKIKKEDGIILGMANMDEFACGGSGETSAFGPTKNPVQADLIPGGTSSGSAASVAAGFCDLALGSDTGGSIRNPASHCGVVGLKPSYGYVSRYGLVDMAMSFDQIGPISKNVEDAALLLDVIKGRDEKDPISYERESIKLESLRNKKVIIGVIKPLAKPNVQNLIDSKIEEAIKRFSWNKKLVEIKYIDVAVQTYYPIVYTEVYSGTRKFDGRRFGKKIEDVAGPELLRRILGGSEITKAEYEGRYYKKALQVKELIKEEFEKAFKTVDCVIVPTCPGLPWRIGESMNLEEVYAYDALTIPANLAEICAISIPAGKINGIPVGLQIFCGKGQESKLLSIAKEIESLR
ncbi:Asp-tRNA(Asn)/Glu-tRNA(Gln) amidotransferase GatCAB subunit A [Candidatus Pacearchaeota archaeon CG10_big_fil_rev_8_21_14_0_10_31_9]|nr:MAG: Asp-tRNA(Asn)/Glu-tRNA(Gln) amidotransferase GatCAB subunit A [Candidatus Pacearchaeota archaeon CG10_big_fil_rev_8_21_14_0_10_31_9]